MVEATCYLENLEEVCNRKCESVVHSIILLVQVEFDLKFEELKRREGNGKFSFMGSVMYAMVCMKHDLAYSMSVWSRFIVKPSKPHWHGLK